MALSLSKTDLWLGAEVAAGRLTRTKLGGVVGVFGAANSNRMKQAM